MDTEIRDQLAVDRTHLANERTFLAYVRTGLALVAAGAGMLEFIDTPVARLVGWTFVGVGALTVPMGLWRFLRVRRHLRRGRSASHQA
jgi:putative membrane protein